MYFNNMKYISRFLFMQAFFLFFVEEKLIFVPRSYEKGLRY